MPGLSSTEAKARLHRDGPNVLPGTPQWGNLRVFARAATDPMACFLVIAVAIYCALGDFVDAAIAGIALIPVVGVSLFREVRTSRALGELARLGARRARVWRDQTLVSIPAADLVLGDVVECSEGDIAPADLQCATAVHAYVDRSLVTGESVPELLAVDARFCAGTVLVTGSMTGTVVATGMHTEMGRIGALLRPPVLRRSPLEGATRRWVRGFGVFAGVVGVLVAALQLAYGQPLATAAIAGVTLTLAAIPGELPVVVAVYRALGAVQLARRHALVRNLGAIEMLGAVDVICTDKTGTLTEGRIEAVCVVDSQATTYPIDARMADTAQRAVVVAQQASESQPFDPLEQALAKIALDGAPSNDDALLQDYPFDPEWRTAVHVRRDIDGVVVAGKGAFDALVARGRTPVEVTARLLVAESELAATGMRVLAVAEGHLDHVPRDREDAEASLQILGLIGFRDPVRAEVPAAIAECLRAGVQVVMVTGDHPATAQAIATAVGIVGSGAGTTGAELVERTPSERAALVRANPLVARVPPEQKLQLVEALQHDSAIVAMTGDGVNDAPALRQADVGIAMGKRGTQVAREAADVVLLDDSFPSIVAGIAAGRATMYRISRALTYLIALHLPVIALALIFPLFDVPLLLLPPEILLLEIVLHPTVALVFQADPVPSVLMEQPTRHADHLLSRSAIEYAVAVGIVLGFVAGAMYLSAGWFLSSEQARAVGFVTLLAGQVIAVLASRNADLRFWRVRPFWTRPVVGVIAYNCIVVALFVYCPPVASVFRVTALPLWWFGTAMVVGVGAATATELVKRRTTRVQSASNEVMLG